MDLFFKIAVNPLAGIAVAVITFIICGNSKDYINIQEIVQKYKECFQEDRKTLVFLWLFPTCLAQSTNLVQLADSEVVELVTIILSILTSMLFTIQSLLDARKKDLESHSNYTNSIYGMMVNQETAVITNYEILLSIILLIFCFLSPIWQNSNIVFVENKYFFISVFTIISFSIYCLLYHFLLNLLMVMKRSHQIESVLQM